MNLKRIKLLTFCYFSLLILLAFRFFYIGVVKNNEYTKAVMSQRVSKVEFKSPRGIIYDRNMIKITDSKMKLVVKDGNPYYVGKRTGDLFSHVIGYISQDGIGSGIEGAFDYVLSTDKTSSISYLRDINNNKISNGYRIDVNESYKGISLTLDYHIQKITEDAMDKFKAKGAAIVVDVETGKILAMASRPTYDADNLAKYLNGKDGELLNKAVLQYNPGSVFKIIVATAFLENHYYDEFTFNCTGSLDIDGIEFVCHKRDGHGVQNFDMAFANSCNCAFYELGSIVGIKEIKKYASEFGLCNEVLKINGIYEALGFVPKKVSGKAELANISIGQGDVMATPLQIADMICTICNGGERKQLSLIRGIVDENGICSETYSAEVERVISETTSRRMIELMNFAVTNGTGKNAQIEGCGAGGKTGSAETGWEKNGKIMKQGWFAGYFPAKNPQYACVIIAENGESGSESACPIFQTIGKNISKSGYIKD